MESTEGRGRGHPSYQTRELFVPVRQRSYRAALGGGGRHADPMFVPTLWEKFDLCIFRHMIILKVPLLSSIKISASNTPRERKDGHV